MIAKQRIGMALGAALGIAAAAGPAPAHHSFAMFDMTKDVAFDGVIKEVHWSNPHVWIDVIEQKPTGATEMWGLEVGATNTLARQGWKRDSLKPGDKVKVIGHPMRNGASSASLVSITEPDGRVFTLGAQGARVDGATP